MLTPASYYPEGVKRRYQVLLSLALTAVLVALFLWNVDMGAVARDLGGADPFWLGAAVVLALLSYWLRAVRWGIILRPAARVRHSSLVLTTAVGYAAMTLLPARMGDVIRPVLLARRDRFPVSAALASVLTERLFDMWTVVLFFMVFLLRPPAMAMGGEARRWLHLLTVSGYVLAGGLAAGTLVMLGLFRYQERFIARVTAPVRRLRESWGEAAARFLGHFLDGLRIIRRPRDLAVAVFWSVAIWYSIYWQVRTTMLAFGLDRPLRVAFLLVTLSIIGLAIPTPGGVGGFHKAIQVGLVAFLGVRTDLATGVAIAYHAVCFLPITVVGLLCMPVLGFSLTRPDALGDAAGEGDG